MNWLNLRTDKKQFEKHVIDELLHNKNKNKCIAVLSFAIIFSEMLSKILHNTQAVTTPFRCCLDHFSLGSMVFESWNFPFEF